MESNQVLANKMIVALYAMFVGDSLSMPVHWYYNLQDLKRDFGEIRDFEAPKPEHPSSIMSVSNTGGHGRGDQSGNIIGGVILHDKKQFWGKSKVHYHQGMAPGDNTLNVQTIRVLMRSIRDNHGYDPDAFLKDYVKFMTTPGTHNDTYAESYHRDFFANYVNDVPLKECAGEEGHNTASIGGFTTLPLIVMVYFKHGLDSVLDRVAQHLALTHRSHKLERAAKIYAELLFDLFNGAEIRQSCLAAATKLGVRLDAMRESGVSDENAVGQFGMACYIDGSFPSVLYLAYKYGASPDGIESALLANTNAGGDNCSRGVALGAILGAGSSGRQSADAMLQQRWYEGLTARSVGLDDEINAFVNSVLHEKSNM
eukprot:TRINITY_DN9424_c0_g1_i1.p1 TRINITY_DN9424_c0_g1~~TRINITY_DN9424_c0_g1_i1.p1  ORF type:complete len:377 (-),score=51.75 TRINITY_DN9424_c0_g1_i1:76-1185(-)